MAKRRRLGRGKRLRCEASYAWCSDDWDDAHARAGLLKDGMAGAGLSDGSEEGDWRLPTKSELVGIVQGDEAVSSQTPHWFTGVQSYYYWSSTTDASDTAFAWFVYMSSGYVSGNIKTNLCYVWPVRGDN